MSERIVILGGGPVGLAISEQLGQAGRRSVIAQRKRPGSLPAGAEYEACDALDGAALMGVVQGASTLICTIGLAYDATVWEAAWPKLMTNMLAACSANGARLIFIDNVYMYGPQAQPLREDMPMAATGRKGKVRAAITRQWQASGVKVAALRAPDFYGAGVANSIFGTQSIGALAEGRRATLVVKADAPHVVAYVPDIARAAVLLIDAPDDAYGQVWHVPNAPARSPREILTMAAKRLGAKPRVTVMPGWLMAVAGLFVPMIREWQETHFQHDRPFLIDSSRFEHRFGLRPTPLEEGIPIAAESFRKA